MPFDKDRGVIPNDGGHVLTAPGGDIIPGLYTTGWIKRGPVGLIGNTKSDAKETVDMLLNDAPSLSHTSDRDVLELLAGRGVEATSWQGWYALDAVERAAGEAEGRERKKVVEWEDMLAGSRG